MSTNHASRRTEDGSGQTVTPPDVQRAILQAIAGIDYGSVEIVIHDAKVVQIEARTKHRFGA